MSQNSMFPHIVVFLLYITVVVQALSSGSDNLSSTRNAGPSVKIEKDLYVAGMITSTGLHANNVLLQGEMKVAGGVTANAIKADKLTVESLSTSNIQSSRSDGVINIDGNLVITSHHRPQALSLLAEELVISGIKQWRLVRHDSFQPSSSSYVSSSFSSSPLSESAPKLATEGKGKASESTMSSDGSKKSIDGSSRQGDSGTDGYGWSLSGVSSCSQGQHRVQEEQYTEGTNHSKKENQKTEVYRDPNEEWFLGGPCVIADGEVRKTFTDLPPHTQIKVTAQYHFIDNWQGEIGYAKIEDRITWMHPTSPAAPYFGINMCGHSEFNERYFAVPVEMTVAHAEHKLTVAFGSNALPTAPSPAPAPSSSAPPASASSSVSAEDGDEEPEPLARRALRGEEGKEDTTSEAGRTNTDDSRDEHGESHSHSHSNNNSNSNSNSSNNSNNNSNNNNNSNHNNDIQGTSTSSGRQGDSGVERNRYSDARNGHGNLKSGARVKTANGKDDPCLRSFGIDNVMVYIR